MHIRRIIGILVFVGGVVGLAAIVQRQATPRETIRVGILHSLSGTMAISETAVVDAALLAIAEINAQGGLLGRQIEPVVVDGQSDWNIFAHEAERLITEEKVSVIFGCWTSACRKTVKSVVERQNHLLVYPLQHEGLEISPNIIYTGAAPNQQVIPAVKWSMDYVGKRFFLVGSDSVFPRTANAIIGDQVKSLQGEVVGEEYLLPGTSDVQGIVQKMVEAQPDIILNTLSGDSNPAFFKALRAAGITPDKIPTLSFSLAEHEFASMSTIEMMGDYAAWSYFQSIDNPANQDFVERFRAKYGPERTLSDPMEAAYFGVYLWAQAVEQAGTADVTQVRVAMTDQSFNAPEGIVYVDARTRHTWKTVRIGKMGPDGQFEIVWSSENSVRPDLYPAYRQQSSWEAFLLGLFNGWGQRWENPG